MSISPINVSTPSVLEGSNPNALTAEGLMLYLQTRLTGLDDQIDAVFSKQKKIEAIRKELMKLQQALSTLDETDGWHGTKHPDKGWEMHTGGDGAFGPGKLSTDGMDPHEQEIVNALNAIEALDPSLAKEIRLSLVDKNSVAYLDGRYTGQDVKAFKEIVNNYTKQLESSAQLEMIGLQSTMSARQTAIQLATNLIAGLNKGTDAIAANVGR